MNAAVIANATARPWMWQDGSLYAADDEIVAIGSCDISLASDIAEGMWDQDGVEGFAMKPEDEAFIVEACNSYERVCAERNELVTVLNAIRIQAVDAQLRATYQRTALEQISANARAVLEKVTSA